MGGRVGCYSIYALYMLHELHEPTTTPDAAAVGWTEPRMAQKRQHDIGHRSMAQKRQHDIGHRRSCANWSEIIVAHTLKLDC